jgi:uncharacterized protein YdiU (UPF0061 family)
MKPSAFALAKAALHPTVPTPNVEGPYGAFHQVNGHHPWKYAVPNGYIEYQTRILRRSKVVFFNFPLAKEMGLIAKDHPNTITKDLEKTLVETFALRIINEYDQLMGEKFPEKDIKANRYMATRYLQLQHDNKSGTTSGDGRSIWNGQFLSPNGMAWDLSSCGTGVTRLSPGSVHEGRPVKTGDTQVSYGSGLADVDEGLSAAILSESFRHRGVHTERTLVILESDDGRGINVRAARNLLRPSHLFLHLKQGNQLMLKSALDFYIARQIHNRQWESIPRESEKYDYFLTNIARQYGEFAARLEDEYVFCWLDWDGDNVLMEAGIIDYGSIRQFGLCHHRYRYDDVDRYSTNLKEQKRKAGYLVQTFVQMVDFVRTGQKRDVRAYSESEFVAEFEKSFRQTQLDQLLRRVGLSAGQRKRVLSRHRAEVEEFEKIYRFFERRDTGRGIKNVADGINDPAIFCTRTLLRELPRRMLLDDKHLSVADFLEIMRTPFLTKKEAKRESFYSAPVRKFQEAYLALVRAAHRGKALNRAVLETAMRAGQQNRTGYATGDAIIYVVDTLLAKRKSLSRNEFIKLVEAFIHQQQGVPYRGKLRKKTRKVFEGLVAIVNEYQHTI